MVRNVPKVQEIARAAEITSVLITSTGEPMLNWDALRAMTSRFALWPVEVQTNGMKLNSTQNDCYNDRSVKTNYCDILFDYGMSVIAVSIDHPGLFQHYKFAFTNIVRANMVARVTVNVTDRFKDVSFEKILGWCKELGIRQLLIRRITTPEGAEGSDQAKWIAKHTGTEYDRLVDEASVALQNRGRLLRNLTHGAQVWGIDGISYVCSDWCLQETNDGNNVRSLIFREDGHLYTSWNDLGSIVF